ncbi:transmembrane 6 superfamily member 1-like isoform X1 [Schistocerca piceifrons]|uniref:transmembrane 6 superfamily member 1-like isoform X1 n=1 Tax=Schistocerca piceifrons TaxID=274613 RepID=UPI001F5E3EE2|nr:transmembrane 6 superfamily member 1-like isoform X1 [Schistocerca piceifrons]
MMVPVHTVWSPTVTVAGLCLLAGPIAYAFNNILQSSESAVMLVVAAVIMCSIVIVMYLITRSKIKNKMYYWFGLFAFTSAVDIFAALEADGIIAGFMAVYLKYGEPYLFSPWGSIAAYWDGTVFLISYLIMAYCASNGISYRNLGIHYSAGIINSMIVLLLGGCLSESGMTWCTMLNIPYVIVPVVIGVQCLSEKRNWKSSRTSTLIDKLLALFLFGATLAGLLKGLACLGSQQQLPVWYKSNVEPITMQTTPAPFAWIQGLIMIFYFVPSFIILAFGLVFCPNAEWMMDLSLLVAGATSQAGAAQIGMSLHLSTLKEHQMPSLKDLTAFSLFWATNILTAVLPQIIAVWLCYLETKKHDTVKSNSQLSSSNVINRKSGQKGRKHDIHSTESEARKHDKGIKERKNANMKKITNTETENKKKS